MHKTRLVSLLDCLKLLCSWFDSVGLRQTNYMYICVCSSYLEPSVNTNQRSDRSKLKPGLPTRRHQNSSMKTRHAGALYVLHVPFKFQAIVN